MFKWLLSTLSLSLLTTSLAIAQTPYFQSAKKSAAPNKSVTSPTDFSAHVAKKNAQNNANFKQQLTDKISAIPPPKIGTPPDSAFGKTTMPNVPAAATQDNSAATADTPNSEVAAPTLPAKTPAPSNVPLPTPPAPPVAAPAAAPTPPATRTPSYTGFGSGQSSGGANSNSNSSSGWGVKY